MDYLPQFGQNTTQSTQDQMPQDDTLMQLDLKRKLALADALRQQAAPEGQMVSGHYVAPSWTQYAANLANKYVAGQNERGAMQDYGKYVSDKQLKQANALRDLSGALKPVAETTQGSYDIQVPNNQPVGPTDNLGGMQPYESGKKTISVPITTQTGTTRQPTADEITSAIGKYSSAIHDPALLEKVVMSQVTNALSPKQTEWKPLEGKFYGFDIHGNPTGKVLGTGKEETPGSLEKDYKFAINNGYKGSIEDFKRIPSSWINPFQGAQLANEAKKLNPLGMPDVNGSSSNNLLNPPTNLPKVGEAMNGYIYKGGNPNDPKSWSKQ